MNCYQLTMAVCLGGERVADGRGGVVPLLPDGRTGDLNGLTIPEVFSRPLTVRKPSPLRSSRIASREVAATVRRAKLREGVLHNTA